MVRPTNANAIQSASATYISVSVASWLMQLKSVQNCLLSSQHLYRNSWKFYDVSLYATFYQYDCFLD